METKYKIAIALISLLLICAAVSFVISAPVKADESFVVETMVETSEITTLQKRYDFEEESIMLAKLMYREARGIYSITEQANICWTVLNRVDSELCYFPDTIQEVITQKNQFAWNPETPTVDDYGRDLKELAHKILMTWAYGETEVFRTLPEGYFYYYGDGQHNHFVDDYNIFVNWCQTKVFTGEYDYYFGYLEK